MALSINRLPSLRTQPEREDVMASYRADRRLYLTADREQVCEEGDPRARFLLAAENRIIDADDVARLKLKMKDGKVVYPGMKQRAKPENKMVAKPEDKAAGSEPEEEADVPEWEMSMGPEDYLERWPEGPNADLARQVIAAREA